MLPDNIDDLFRDQLDGHATPPGPDLWARLQAQPGAEPAAETPRPERLDQLFQQRLHTHATPPARELWERLEVPIREDPVQLGEVRQGYAANDDD